MSRATPLAREATLCAAAAAGLAALLAWAGPPGTDLAAHVYQRAVFLDHGFTFWNNFWYAGRYSFVTYSLLYYPLAAALGIRLLAVATVSTATLAFAVLVWREWGAHAGRAARSRSSGPGSSSRRRFRSRSARRSRCSPCGRSRREGRGASPAS